MGAAPIHALIAGGIGGLITGLALRGTQASLPWKQVPVIAIGWSLAWAIYLPLVGVAVNFLIGGAIGGLITGLALSPTQPSIPWKQILVVAFGWATMIGVVNWAMYFVGSIVAGMIAGSMGGLITALALRRTRPSMSWKQVVLVAVGWGLAMTVGLYIYHRVGVG
jgi:hypothetical protein